MQRIVWVGLLLFLFAGSYAWGQGLSERNDEPDFYKRSIYFGGGSYQIDPFQARRVYEFIDSLQSLDFYTITIHSYTDDIGGAEYNAWLSDMRSYMVTRMLMEKAIPENRIKSKAFGQFNPVYDNRTWEGRRLNRRVDIIFWPMAM